MQVLSYSRIRDHIKSFLDGLKNNNIQIYAISVVDMDDYEKLNKYQSRRNKNLHDNKKLYDSDFEGNCE